LIKIIPNTGIELVYIRVDQLKDKVIVFRTVLKDASKNVPYIFVIFFHGFALLY
jgi:hypothetical protein